jgi:large subunit ribosomal protein L21
MFAIVRTGGKQYRVAAGDKIVVEKLAGEAGDTITLDDVLLAGDGGDLKKTDGLTVSAEIIAQAKGEKVTVFKKKRRHNYRRKRGHRQQHTILRIVAIGDQKAAPKKAAAKATPSADEKPAAEKPAAKKAAPKPSEGPNKIEGAESEMTDTPAAKKPAKETGGAKAKAEAPAKKEGKASEQTDTPAKGDAAAAPKKKASTKKPAADKNA